ncbi:hypothetical protein [Ammoniphilus sp. CFH 90114]|uniref:hypothetical protein n=1 Tax=Ammoniphilus sp. CFH 90114 TaxID=2493665 RepID=UPI00100EE53A|nr:hypothetical protein [Ammoniphilus sp. CFH 90114]RXT13981.1 hypothetical protein EIZ39_07555 [Ammoniphilus sp. CFH 90114]
MLICSVTTNNHIPRAKVMAKSIKEHMPHAIVVLCVVEKKLDPSLWDFTPFDNLVLAKDLGLNHFNQFIFKYNRFEAANSLKAALLKYVMDQYKQEQTFVYLDTDIRLYAPLTEIPALFSNHDILFTPHTTIQASDASVPKFELPILRTGIFNAGFLALKNSKESRRFLDWWHKRLEHYCYKDIAEGLFFDQKWLNLALYFFNAGAITHPGYNVAYWNTANRKVSLKEESWRVNGEQLKFFHFSGAETGRLKSMVKKFSHDSMSQANLLKLKDRYMTELREMGQQNHKKTAWSYDFFASGEPIFDESRIAYRKNFASYQKKKKNPFKKSNRYFLK